MRKAILSLVLSALTIFLLSGPVFAVSIRHDRTDDQYIQLADDYPSVGKFVNGFSNGSGVLIAPQWVLMASHNLIFQAEPFAFEIGGQVYQADWTQRQFAELPVPYSADFVRDLALVHLDQPVTGVTPAQLYDGTDEAGLVATIVGYGVPGDGVNGAPSTGPQDTKRAGQNVIDAIGTYDGSNVTLDPLGPMLFYDYDNPPDVQPDSPNWFGGSNTPLDLEGMLTAGDSGGGVFAEIPAGPSTMRKLIGISSGVFPGDSSGPEHQYGIAARNIRVSTSLDWINDTMAGFESGSEPLIGLVGEWDFNDLSEGFAQDVSGVGHRGDVIGAVSAPGVMAGAIEFRTSPSEYAAPLTQQEYVEIPNETSPFGGVVANDLKITDDITISAWVYRVMSGGADGSSTTDVDTIVAKSPVSAPDRDFSLVIWEDQLRFYDETENFAGSSAHNIAYETWQHVAATRQGSTVKFYVCGQEIGAAQLADPGPFRVSDSPLLIGNYPDAGFNYSGRMDDLRVYSRSLSPAEIGQLVSIGDPGGNACSSGAAEAFFDLHQETMDGDTGFKVGVARGFSSGALASFSAQLTYQDSSSNPVELQGIRCVAIQGVLEGNIPFPTDAIIDNFTGMTTFGGVAPSGVSWPADLAHALTRLTGSADQQCQVDLQITSLTDVNGISIAVPATLSQTVQRGDARADGEINIGDALFIAQHLVGLRESCTTDVNTTCLHSVNAASVQHDGDFDETTIADALFVAQYLVGSRDEFYNVPP